MSLSKYKEKRSFDKTPEPPPKLGSAGNKLLFVIQKHAASHLHYDFRLEMKGVLKSWAVPKGPSMNPDDKRLAMMVEDHPWAYKDFEGIIPEHNYGAGTVIVWDQGSYEPVDVTGSKKEMESALLKDLYKGRLHITMKGKKLKGEFSLVKTSNRGENAWLLFKNNDKYALKADITKKDKSVVSNLTLDQVKRTSKNTWQSNRQQKPAKNTSSNENKGDNISNTLELIRKKGKKSKMPERLEPMLCTLIKEPFDDDSFLFEVKLDGYRVTAHVDKKKTTLYSRSGLNYTKAYKLVTDELSTFEMAVVLDGELVALDKEGKPNFDELQRYDGTQQLIYYVFDMPWCNGYDLSDVELEERKEMLRQILPGSELIRYSDHFDNGMELFDLIKSQGMEGIVAKKKNSKYAAGKRSKDWLKIPVEQKQEFVIGGWSESSSGTPFRSLLFGYYVGNKLKYIGHAGLGFKEKEKTAILEKLKQIRSNKSPFYNDTDVETKVHWVKPQLVADIKFATWTRGGKIRKPATFLGFRKDKDPLEVIEEKQAEDVITPKVKDQDVKQSESSNEESNWKYIKQQKISSEETFNIEGNDVVIQNVEKELWKGITKADLIAYYHAVAPWILPYLKNRPLSLHLKPDSVTKPGMYIKDMEGNAPEYAEVFQTKRKHRKKGKRDMIEYLVCNNEATLLYVINLGCIDLNPWTSTTASPLEPDYIIIDLDPSDDDFSKVIKTAIAAKKVFDKLKLSAFPKTSGKTGMHIYIPCTGFSFPEARSIAEKICSSIHQLVPGIATTEVTIAHRGDKLYIDPNQNDEADTVASPYSVRPHYQPTVSTPLEWKEINAKLKPGAFDIHTILERIKKKGDVFEKVNDKKLALANSRILRKLLG